MKRHRLKARSGFSLVELLVAVVLLGIVGGALTRLLVDQMRFFDKVQVARGARSAARNSMNVMLSELRMVQDSGGVTAIGADNKSITVRVPYRFGVICKTTAGTSIVSMLPGDSLTLSQAVYAGYGWRDRITGRYNQVTSSTTPASSGSTDCTTANIKTVSINGRTGGVYSVTSSTVPTTMGPGWPIMWFQSVKYSFEASSMFPGKVGLYRTVGTGTPEELMAPFASDARFRYYQATDDTSRTTAPALSDIRGIEMDLTTEGQRKPAGTTSYAQNKMVTSVFFKNVRAYGW
jgi:prepilin-type N-terminal cleavage/methylation domain-containing protein